MNLFSSLLTFAALSMVLALPAYAQFDGNLELLPKGCKSTGQCILKDKLRFTDAAKVVWEAKAGLVTDGASIPGIFQPLIGQPFEDAFIKAAIIHDHYCDRHVRPWRQTHRVFYEALLATGVPKARAKTMYLAVMIGGPKWVELIPGINCGKGCVNSIKTINGVPGVRYRPADYSVPGLTEELQTTLAKLEGAPDSVTLDDLDVQAKRMRPTDYYFLHSGQVTVPSIGVLE